jgi:DNA-binding beta-propeller fold protein YncE
VNRRKFLGLSARGIGLVGLTPLAACSASGDRRSEREVDPGRYRVGERHLVFGPAGAAYRLDVEGHRVVRVAHDGADGAELARFGTATGELNHPVAGVVDPAGRLLVLDRGNGRVQAFSAEGEHLGTLVSGLSMPRDLGLSADELLVCDTHAHRVQVHGLDGAFRRSLTADLNGPMGVAVSVTGEVHVLDAGSARVQVFSAAGAPLRTYGEGRLGHPRALTIAPDGRTLVADPSAARVHLFRPSGEYFGHFRPRRIGGGLVTPVRITPTPDRGLYVWTAGRAAHDARA